jgi:hypothetical protein
VERRGIMDKYDEGANEGTGRKFKDDWLAIGWCMQEQRIDPARVSYLTNFPEQNIKRGINGEPIPIPLMFLKRFIKTLGLVSTRSGNIRSQSCEDPLDSMSYDECMKLIKPPPAMPPRQGYFWETEEEV